jgi:hypothetical protein
MRFKSIYFFKIFIYLKLIFSVFLDHFNVLILKIIFFKKYYFNIFSNKKYFKNQMLPQY